MVIMTMRWRINVGKWLQQHVVDHTKMVVAAPMPRARVITGRRGKTRILATIRWPYRAS